MWEPLPHIYSGLVVHPFHPASSQPASPTTTIRSGRDRGRDSHSRDGHIRDGHKDRERDRDRDRDSHKDRDGHKDFKNRFSWSGIGGGRDDHAPTRGNPHEVSLDVGDEFFAFEEYRAADGEQSVWYRG
jgi:hypothetical protein